MVLLLMVETQLTLAQTINQRMVLLCWLLLLLTTLQVAESLPQPREELESTSQEPRNLREIRPDNGNINDDMLSDLTVDKAIQDVFYPENPTLRDSGHISIPDFNLPSPKIIDFKKQKENIPQSFQDDEKYLPNNILQYRYNPYLNTMPSWQKKVKKPSNHEILQNILDLKDFDLKQISLKQAFLNKAETYNITEIDDTNNFLVEKKVNVSRNLKYLNSNNQLANFSEFSSSILQEMIKSGHNNSYSDHPSTNSFRNHHTAEQYGNQGKVDSRDRLNLNNFVGGQFIEQEELPGAQYPRIRTQFEEPYEHDLINNPDKATSAQDFVGGQFVGYSNRFLSQSRTPQNTNPYEIGLQPSDFVEGQFVGRPENSQNDMLGKPLGEDNALTTMDLSSAANNGIGPTNDENTERYEQQYSSELSSLSILGMQDNKNDVDKEPTDVTKQAIMADRFNKKILKQQDDIPILMGGSPKFNKGISQALNIVQQTINEPGHSDQTTINTVEPGNSELGIPQNLDNYDLKPYSYSTTIDSLNHNSFENEMTTTERKSINSESSVYEDYGENDNLGSIIDDGNNAKEQSDEIQGQPSQISSNFMGTTKQAIRVVPLSGVSFENDYYNTLQETSTQIVKDVYLYAGKDYEKGSLGKRPDLNEVTLNSNKDKTMTEEEAKENYLTEICFQLKNKKDISLLDILSGNIYLENNGKKIPLSLGKNPMKNCTSGTTSCRLYIDLKNVSQVLHENEEDNLVLRNKRESKSDRFSLIESQLEQNESGRIQNKQPFKYTRTRLNLFPMNRNTSLPPNQQKDYSIEPLTTSHDESKKERYKEYTQPSLFPMHEVTSHKSRAKRSTADSDSCSCSSLFKSTQIPSYKYFVNKRFDILTNIVLAAKHFMDSP